MKKISTRTKRDVIATIQSMISDAEKGVRLRRAEIESLRRKLVWLRDKLEDARKQEPSDAA